MEGELCCFFKKRTLSNEDSSERMLDFFMNIHVLVIYILVLCVTFDKYNHLTHYPTSQ